ncbi:uncharacterized protein NEMAJ01_2333, partial [Nematocida major]|uniref:uncharacterized protein n=1 Tax=Nematocida major TaxID=1912982 RepID=UPI002007ECB5
NAELQARVEELGKKLEALETGGRKGAEQLKRSQKENAELKKALKDRDEEFAAERRQSAEELEEGQEENAGKDARIEELEAGGQQSAEKLRKALEENAELRARVEELEKAMLAERKERAELEKQRA